LIIPDGKRSIFLIMTTLMLTATLGLQMVVHVNAATGDYIVTEPGLDKLSRVTPSGVRTEIYSFTAGTGTVGVAIDSGGNYMVAEYSANKLSKVTPAGVRTEVYSFAAGTGPVGIVIDSDGNYIVTEYDANKLSKVTPESVRTEKYVFAARTYPDFVVIERMSVGGVVEPMSSLTMTAPCLALVGLVGAALAVR